MATARNTVLFLARLEANEIGVAQLDLRGVFDEQNAFVVGNEFGENSEGRRLSSPGATADEDVLSGQDVVFETVGERLIERPGLNQSPASRNAGC